MAYGLLYYNEFTQAKTLGTVRINISKLNYTGASYIKKIGCVLAVGEPGDEPTEPIKKTFLKLSLISETDQEFIQFFTNNDKEFKVDYLLNGNLIASGFIESDSYSEPYYSDRNYNININAKDNLGSIENDDFVDENRNQYTGLDSALNIITKCLAKTGLTLPIVDEINIFAEGMTETSTLAQEYINQEGFVDSDGKPYNCQDVIIKILEGHTAQLRQLNGQWVIREIGNFYELPNTTKGDGAGQYRWINSDSELAPQPAWKKFKLIQDYKAVANIFKDIPKSDDDFYKIGATRTAYGLVSWDMADIAKLIHYPDINDTIIRIPPSSATGALTNSSLYLNSTTNSVEILFKVRVAGVSSFGQHANPISRDIVVDIISNNSKIMTVDGWVDYTGQTKQLTFKGIQESKEFKELTVIASSVPESGNITIKLWPDDDTTNLISIDYEDIIITITNESGSTTTGASLGVIIDDDNNITPDDIELEIGEVPDFPNAKSLYYGGLYSSAGNALKNWHRKGDTNILGLLDLVAHGYALYRSKNIRRISGSLIWKSNVWTNIVEYGHTYMVNSIEFNVSNCQANIEFIEVFQYEDIQVTFEAGQITDGEKRDFFKTDENLDYLSYSGEIGEPKRVCDLSTAASIANACFLVDDPAKGFSEKTNVNAISEAILKGVTIDSDGNIFVPGNVFAYSTGADPGSIFDNLPIASTTSKGIAQFSATYFNVADGLVTIKPDSVGLNEAALAAYLTDNAYATQSWVSSEIAKLVDSAPATLDTLNELAAALGDDPNFATTMTTLIGTKLAKASNLSDLTDKATARTNLGVDAAGTLGGIAAGNYYHTGNANKSDVNWTTKIIYSYGELVLRRNNINANGDSGECIINYNAGGGNDYGVYIKHNSGDRLEIRESYLKHFVNGTGYDVYTSRNANKSDVDWTAKTLKLYATGDGATLLQFNQEGAWAFKQRSTGASSILSLEDLAGAKSFRIYDAVTNKVGAQFTPNGNQELFSGGIRKFETISTGAKTIGNHEVTEAAKAQTFELRNSSGVKKWTIQLGISDTLEFRNAAGVLEGVMDQSGNLKAKGDVFAFAI